MRVSDWAPVVSLPAARQLITWLMLSRLTSPWLLSWSMRSPFNATPNADLRLSGLWINTYTTQASRHVQANEWSEPLKQTVIKATTPINVSNSSPDKHWTNIGSLHKKIFLLVQQVHHNAYTVKLLIQARSHIVAGSLIQAGVWVRCFNKSRVPNISQVSNISWISRY